MTAFKCDRCGKYFDKIEYFKKFKITGYSVIGLKYKMDNGVSFDLELCPECIENFKSWFKAFEIGTPEGLESEETDA